MISDLPYEVVVERCGLGGLEQAERGLPLELFPRMLRQLTGAEWRRRRYWRLPLVSEMVVANETAIWITTRAWWKRRCHAIAVDGEWVYDPALEGEWPRRHYPRADWRVAAIFEMVGAGSPAALRVARRLAARQSTSRTETPWQELRSLDAAAFRTDAEG